MLKKNNQANSVDLILEELDDSTNSIKHSLQICLPTSHRMLEGFDFEKNTCIELSRNETESIKQEFGILSEALPSRLRKVVTMDALPYVCHTGRELNLMLENKKPFSAFISMRIENLGTDVLFNQYFDEFVKCKAIVEYKETVMGPMPIGDTEKTEYDFILYSLPGEEWRFRAYMMLKRHQFAYGWCRHLEMLEGQLLGYKKSETEIYLNSGLY